MAAKILSGISYPFRIEDNGLPAPAKGVDAIRASLVVLLKTPKRSRVMRPNLGTDLSRLIFENQGPFLLSLVRREILTAVLNYLPQVNIEKIDFMEDNKKLQVNVFYTIQGVKDETGFVNVGG